MKRFSGVICAALFLLMYLPQGKASSLCDAVAGNLVANCGFETGDFTSWSLSGNDVPAALNNLYGVEGIDPVDSIAPNSGAFQAYFADLVSNATTLSQTITTIPGDQYLVSWDLVQDTPVAAPYSNEFVASFGVVTLVSGTALPVQGYTNYSYTISASAASTLLSLTLGNDLGQFLLDDVSVTQTPEPSAWILAVSGVLLGLVFRRDDFMRRKCRTGC